MSKMGWSDLPVDLGSAIADRLTELADLARFRSVCPSWRSASAAHAARRRVPRLLIPTQSYGTRVHRDFWCPADDSVAKIHLPAARGRSFLFASHRGWTLAVASDLSAILVHPFTGASAELPALPFVLLPRDRDSEEILRNLRWDWSPHGVVVASPTKGAFFCKPGDGSWRPLGCSSAGVVSVSYCDGAFYIFEGKTCKATVVDAETLAVAAVIEKPAIKVSRWSIEANLVISSDELLLIVRERWDDRSFKIFRSENNVAAAGRAVPRWLEVTNIGDRAIFVDHLRAFCVEANGLNGVRSNCVYIAKAYEMVNDDYGMDVWGRYTVSVLDITARKTESLGYGNLLNLMCTRFWQYASWSSPNPR